MGHRAVAALVVCVLAAGSLPQPAWAAPLEATQTVAPGNAAPAALALRIGALSERLFDAAEASQWPAARLALQALHEQARLLDGSFENRFLAAGGGLDALYSARNGLDGDLADADIAASAMAPLALGKAANSITLRAGELAQPFAEASGAPVALKVDAVMFQARRMLDALVWDDQPGFESAHEKFRRLWSGLRDSSGLADAKVAALDRALAKAALSRNEATVRELQSAAQDAVGDLGMQAGK